MRGFFTDNDDLNRRISGALLINRYRPFRDLLEHELPLAITKEILGPQWWKPMINFPMTTDAATLEGSSMALRQRLGHSSVAIGFDEPWTHAPDAVNALLVPPKMDW